MIDRDKLMNMAVSDAGRAAMQVVDALQNHRPEAQVVGACAAFLLLAEASGMPAQDLFSATKNLINGAEGKRPEFAAVSMYIELEINPR
jgi:hypothetical protein